MPAPSETKGRTPHALGRPRKSHRPAQVAGVLRHAQHRFRRTHQPHPASRRLWRCLAALPKASLLGPRHNSPANCSPIRSGGGPLRVPFLSSALVVATQVGCAASAAGQADATPVWAAHSLPHSLALRVLAPCPHRREIARVWPRAWDRLVADAMHASGPALRRHINFRIPLPCLWRSVFPHPPAANSLGCTNARWRVGAGWLSICLAGAVAPQRGTGARSV